MKDIAGVGEIVNSKVVERTYEDAISPAAKQTGLMGEDLLKTLRLFTAPIQLLAAYQDRLAAALDTVRKRVPPEQQVEAAASVAGPVLLNMRFVEDDNPLRALYLNLLTAAIDRDRQTLAHPGYVKIIEQLSPVEAMVMFHLVHLRQINYFATGTSTTPKGGTTLQVKVTISLVERPLHFDTVPGPFGDELVALVVSKASPAFNQLNQRALLPALNHLDALGLISCVQTEDRGVVITTAFGKQFSEVCLPKEWIGA